MFKNIVKAWLYIAIAAAFFGVLTYMVEIGSKKPTTEVEPIGGPLVEQETSPEPDHQENPEPQTMAPAEEPSVETADSGTVTTPIPSQDETREPTEISKLPEVREEIRKIPLMSDALAEKKEETAQSPAQNTDETKTETEPLPTNEKGKGEGLPVTEKPVLQTVYGPIPIRDHTIKPNTVDETKPLPEPAPVPTCLPVMGGSYKPLPGKLKSAMVYPAEDTKLYAVLSGPITSLEDGSAIQHSESGNYMVIYRQLGTLNPTLKVGDNVTCGQVLAESPKPRGDKPPIYWLSFAEIADPARKTPPRSIDPAPFLTGLPLTDQ